VRHPVEYQAAWALIILSSAFFWSAYVVLWGATRLGSELTGRPAD
jgi:hypothetical protein